MGPWAIARALVIEISRMKGLVAFIIMVTCTYTFGTAAWIFGDDMAQLDEKVQTFLSHSIRFMASFLSLLTIFISTLTVSRDLKRKEIYTISTKPISRLGYLAGKLLGVCIVNLILLTVSGLIIFSIARYPNEYETAGDEEKRRLDNLVLVARKAIYPEFSDKKTVADRMASVEAERQKKDNPDLYDGNPQAYKNLVKGLEYTYFNKLDHEESAVGPMETKTWLFKNVIASNRDKGYIFIRYKQDVTVNPANDECMIENNWAFGPDDPKDSGYNGTGYFKEIIRTYHEFPVKADNIAENGDFYVSYRNIQQKAVDQNITVLFPAETGIQVLYSVGTFEENFIRAILLIYLRLIFLSVLGIVMGAWLSFPVAVLAVMVVYFLGLSSEFLLDAIRMESGRGARSWASVAFRVLPQLARHDPVECLELGRIISNEMIRDCLLYMIVIKAGLLSFFGFVVYRFRELARVIV